MVFWLSITSWFQGGVILFDSSVTSQGGDLLFMT